jgi:propionate CoA-transferase
MRIMSAPEAVALIPDRATVLVDGSGGGVNEPGLVLAALEQRYLDTGSPQGLTAVHVSGMGDGHGGGMDRLSHEGMVRRVIGGHWGWTQGMQQLAVEEKIEAYCLPQGTLSHLLRDIAAGRPGAISAVGLGTFVDPRRDGGRLNKAAEDDLVQLVELGGREWIFTPAFPIDVAIIRGSRADTAGNLTMDGEGLLAETLSAAQAARNSGGIVIAQVREVVEHGSIDPRRVRVPGILVDALVVDPDQRLSFATERDPYRSGDARSADVRPPLQEHSVRKVIARRAALELRERDIINLGFGMPDGVGSVLAEAGLDSHVTFTVEQGHIGGVPVDGADFGLAYSPDASLDSGHQFDWYDGGGLDVAVLSFAQVDRAGNVNVGRFNGRIPGVGGFINISQGSKRVIFIGTFVAGGRYRLDLPGRPLVVPQGGSPKFVGAVEQISFSGERAREVGQPVLYVTERAVFALGESGLELIEIAPGLDLYRDVLAHMEFTPGISPDLTEMDPRLYASAALHIDLQREREETA